MLKKGKVSFHKFQGDYHIVVGGRKNGVQEHVYCLSNDREYAIIGDESVYLNSKATKNRNLLQMGECPASCRADFLEGRLYDSAELEARRLCSERGIGMPEGLLSVR